MKKRSDETLKVTSFDPHPLNAPLQQRVRYEGFESIAGGRRLRFAAKPVGHEWMVITIDISDAVFTGAPGISLQDAAPLVYEKIVEVLAVQDTLDPSALCLTDADVQKYITRRFKSQKRVHSSDGRRRSDTAA